MKKIFSALLIFIFIISFFPEKIFASEEKCFVVTAYYSPLPGQDYYMRGTLEKEKILQGNGTHGASGKAVFSGMLAAPKTYAFGTKIYLEGLGVGVVEDRGQAIVQKGERGYRCDRLDVWMGYGDEGLKRALAWGKRTVKGKVLSRDAKVTIDYKKFQSPDWAVSGLEKQEKTPFDLYLGKESKAEDVKKLQTLFREVGLYSGEIDGVYNSEIISIVFDFQVKNGILKDASDLGAGYWGEKTKTLFKKKYLAGDFDKKEEEKKDISSELNFDIFSTPISSEEDILEVEKIFKEIGFLDEEITLNKENFSENILNFQLEEEIILSDKEPGAGNYGPKTRAKLKEKYEIFQDEKIAKEKQILELKEKYSQILKESDNLALEKIKNIKDRVFRKGETSVEVRELQEILAELGYFQEKSTAIFGEKTFDAVVKFQLDNELIENENSEFAGIIGEKGISKIVENFQKIYLAKKIEEHRFSEEELEIIEQIKKDNL